MQISRSVFAGATALALILCESPEGLGAATKVIHFAAASMKATATYAGSCPSVSQVAAGAYLCSTHGHGRYDPCFPRSADRVGCPVDVVGDSGVVVSVTALPTPAPGYVAPNHPWAMRLVQGQFCIHAPGFTALHGYGYSCGVTACSIPTLAPLNATYSTNCTPIASTTPQPRPFFVAKIWK